MSLDSPGHVGRSSISERRSGQPGRHSTETEGHDRLPPGTLAPLVLSQQRGCEPEDGG